MVAPNRCQSTRTCTVYTSTRMCSHKADIVRCETILQAVAQFSMANVATTVMMIVAGR